MGIPAPLPCAAPECQKHATPASAGVFFTPASLFSKDMPHEAQLWACSVEHKRDALHEILKDLPYRHAKR